MEVVPPTSVIFLDVDGVLNTSLPDSQSLSLGECFLQRVCGIAQAANGDVDAGASPRAVIIVSSDWRRNRAMLHELVAVLSASGLTVAGSIPPDLCKTEGIKSWLMSQGSSVTSWVALDDFDLLGLDEHSRWLRGGAGALPPSIFAGHFVQTDETLGLTDANAQMATSILASGWAGKAEQLAQVACELRADPAAPAIDSQDPLAGWRQGNTGQSAAAGQFRCDDCGQLLKDSMEVRVHMHDTDGDHCTFSEV